MTSEHLREHQLTSGATLLYRDEGSGPPLLLLHGAAGPESVRLFGQALARDARVITPVHPGFAKTERPRAIDGVEALASAYRVLITSLRLQGCVVLGFSLGGWIAAEMAAGSTKGLSGLILVDAVGISVPGEPVLDPTSVPHSKLPNYAYHRPEAHSEFVSTLSDGERESRASNLEALMFYGGETKMQDPTLAGRLSKVDLPVELFWGESDRVVTPNYGRAYAQAFKHGRFTLIEKSGHLPQIENPSRLLALVRGILSGKT